MDVFLFEGRNSIISVLSPVEHVGNVTALDLAHGRGELDAWESGECLEALTMRLLFQCLWNQDSENNRALGCEAE